MKAINKSTPALLVLLPLLIAGDSSEPRTERDANLGTGSIHLSPHPVHHPLPTRASGYPYSPSQPSYPAYHPPPPPPHRAEPIYGHHPSHNCTVEVSQTSLHRKAKPYNFYQDEILQAEICTPTYTSSCGPFKVKGTKLGEKEKCVTVTRTVCTQGKGGKYQI